MKNSPIDVLQQAIKAVPAVKYALGVAGIVAAVMIVVSFTSDLRIAVFGTVLMLILMVVLLVFAKMASAKSDKFALPGLVFTWFAIILTMTVATLLVSSVFFRKPIDLQKWLTGENGTVEPDNDVPWVIEGYILDSITTGPLDKAFVEITGDAVPTSAVTSGDDGKFEFSGSAEPGSFPGKVKIQATWNGIKKDIVAEITGATTSVKIEIPASRPPFKRTYLTLGGRAMEVLGHENRIATSLENDMGGGTSYVLQNDVLKELNRITAQFAVFNGWVWNIDGAIERRDFVLKKFEDNDYDKQKRIEQAALLRDMAKSNSFFDPMMTIATIAFTDFVEDVEFSTMSMNDLFRDTFSSASPWEIFRQHEGPELESLLASGEGPWTTAANDWYFVKNLRKSDLDAIFANADLKSGWDNQQETLVKFMKYLTRSETPPGFVIAHHSVGYGGCNGDEGVDLNIPEIHVKVLFIENDSEDTIEIGEIQNRQTGKNNVRSRLDQDSAMESAEPGSPMRFGPGKLKPGERIAIPIEIVFKRDAHDIERYSSLFDPGGDSFHRWATNLPGRPILKKVDFNYRDPESGAATPGFSLSGAEFVAGLKAAALKTEQKAADEEFVFGPSMKVESVMINQVEHEITKFAPLLVAYMFGYEGASCPYIYSKNPESGSWEREAPIMTGYVGKQSERPSALTLLRNTVTEIRIAEEEDEISYIDELYLKAWPVDGGDARILRPKDESLAARDGNYLVLNKGETYSPDFEISGGDFKRITVWATGYYDPLN